MKIVYCVFDCSNFGGTERTLSLQANYFAEHGDDVTIITTEIPMRTTRAYYFSDKIHFINLHINYAEVDGSLSPVKIWKRINKGRQHKHKLQDIFNKTKPDIIVSLFSHEMSILNKVKGNGLTVAQLHFSKKYRMIENRLSNKSMLAKLFVIFKEWRKRQHLREYDAFVVLTHEDASNWNLGNIHVIPNATPFATDHLSPLTEKKIITVGRLNKQKGYDQLLKAWSIVSAKHPDWSLSIYGSGEEYEKLAQIIKDNNLSHSCTIFDPVPNIRDKYLQSSIYVMSSQYEGFPMVLVEAMSCGLPCVSYTCPCGPSDIISDGVDGMLVPMNDYSRLAEKICTLIENPALRKSMGTCAVEKVSHYSVENVMHKWESLFSDLLRRNSKGVNSTYK